ncbi:MAG: A/G-specific adenine glycosylase [Phycisphaeraceae bacterium]|nr:A/G-specific adenine glycosylase [Phycisphaeraceae bacterium]
MPSRNPSQPADLARSISRWYVASARPLPWRTSPRDPYLALVSEFMLQQTQVARVLERFPAFIASFPSVHALASAPLSKVLAAWSGLGYYRRARNLHAAARHIVEHFNGRVPPDPESLQELPGVGRYTAGAISSIVFHRPVPIVDGNVARVLMRLDGKPFPHASPQALRWAWTQAESLLAAAAAARLDPAPLNEGLMELGAIICTPRTPACNACPLSDRCTAFRKSLQNKIPAPRPSPTLPRRFCEAVIVRDSRGRLLVEQRPHSGMWAGLWQAPTWERSDRAARANEVEAWIGAPVTRKARFRHATSHRDMRFTVWEASEVPSSGPPTRKLLSPSRIRSLALSSPQERILLQPAR